MQELHKQVIDFQRRVNDMIDDHGHAAARRLKSEIQALEDDLQVRKNARSIEDRVKRIISHLQGEARSAQIMDYAHLDSCSRWFEGLRASLQRLQ